MKKELTRYLSVLTLLLATTLMIHAQNKTKPITIGQQGSFTVGGTQISEAGTFDLNNALKPQGQTFHGDHAYVFYQLPVKKHKYPLVFLHGAGQSKKSWETTPDGREGFQNIFLRRGFGVYLLDQPRRGEAGRSTVAASVTPTPDEQFWFTQFRIGNYPDYFQGVQFPKDSASLEQFFRQMTPNTGGFDGAVVSDAISQLFNRIGDGILVTHSQGGGPGWLTAVKNDNVKAIVAYEPYSGFVFPSGELPLPIKSAGLFGELKGVEIPPDDFKKLTRIPIVIYYGDNIAKEPTSVWNKDHWRGGLEMARTWAAVINKSGGDATVVHLPELGIRGNTHFLFSDLNNIEVADLLSKWLKKKDLTGKGVSMMNKLFKSVLVMATVLVPGTLVAQKNAEQNLNAKQQAVVRISSLTGKGELAKLRTELNAGLDAGLTVNQVKEVLVHVYAYAGFPRSIRGLQTFMAVLDERKAGGINDVVGAEASRVDDERSKYERGRSILDTLTGTPQNGPLTGYSAFAPQIDTFLKEHLFADIFERDLLTYSERELVTVSVLSSIGGVEPMLQSHFRICLNVGLTTGQLRQFVEIIKSTIGDKESQAAHKVLDEVLKSKR